MLGRYSFTRDRMPSDNPVARRNALIIPGGLVLCYCLLAIMYAELVRSDDTLCNDGGRILIRNVCYNVWKLMLPFALVGLGVLLGGALGIRTRRTGSTAGLYHGTGSHFTLAFLASLVVLPLLGLIVQFMRERLLGKVFVIHAYDIAFQHTFLLAVATLVGSAAFFPYLGLYLHQDKRRRRFLDMADLPRAETVLRVQEPPDDEGDGMWAPLEEEWDGDEPWDEETGIKPIAAGRRPAKTGGLDAESDSEPVAAPSVLVDGAETLDEGVTEIIDSDLESLGDDATKIENAAESPPEPEPRGAGFLAALEARDAAKAAKETAQAAPGEAPETAPEAEPESGADLRDASKEVDRLKEPGASDGPKTFLDYPCEARPVSDLPGIDRDIITLLAQVGVRTTAGLRHKSDQELAHAASVPTRRARGWRSTAELMCVPGIGPSYAVALVTAGVDGVDDLKRLSVDSLLRHLGPDRPAAITPKRLQAWQEAAQSLERIEQPVPLE